jgi:alanyl-tRNA synthetase
MKTDELREKYLSFFESKGCVRRPSDVLVPRSDKTVLFTPAGMNQFKNQFLGIGPIDFTRATTCQKCIRTGDIGNVGVTTRHHTFFEMLGNFSFGDYFKKEAIHWAWEFLTAKNWLGLDKDRLTVTVYLDDDEAFNIWHKEVGLDPSRISRLDEAENFWPASAPSQGPDGVCGPCSEIYYLVPGAKEPVEIWNLVFTQFNRVGAPPNNLHPLPKKNIDTGMGLERTASVLQGVLSNFEIDSLKPLCIAAGDAVGVKYEYAGKTGRPMRRIADHIRACTFAIHEGVAPGANGAEYIIRLLLRRALLEGYLLGKQEPFLHKLVPDVIQAMKIPYPELAETELSVVNTIRDEESTFLATIERGLSKFDKLVEKVRKDGSSVLPGEAVFDLHQTDGFVFDLTSAIAADRGLTVDAKGFSEAEEEHKKKSGQGSWGVMSAGPLDKIQQEAGDTKFLAYESTESPAKIVGILVQRPGATEMERVDTLTDIDVPAEVVLDQSPFYGESGGQVGDVGTLIGLGHFEVTDTIKHSGLLVHRGVLKSGTLNLGEKIQAVVDADRRAGIRRAHSATHILHYALHRVIGHHATQRGSKVDNDQLRFDFSHGAAMSADELQQVEKIINECIVESAPVSINYMKIEEAKAAGAMALFGEKYPDIVRMVSMGEFSKELCGGTHLTSTGQVGLCRVISEEPIAAGIRRITAVTGERAIASVHEQEAILKQLGAALKSPARDLPARVTALQDEIRALKQDLAVLSKASIAHAAVKLLADAQTVGTTKLICQKLEKVDRDQLRMYANELVSTGGSVALILGAVIDDKVAFIAAVSKDLIKKAKAGDCVKAAAAVAGGGGGGKPDMAEAGGRMPEKLDEALAAGRAYLAGALG